MTILRTPVKTITFFLLITAVTISLSLGLGMWQSSEQLSREAEAALTTAGQFTYDGTSDASVFDERLAAVSAAFDLADIITEDTLFAEESITQRAYVSDYRPSVYGAFSQDFAVIVVSIQQYNEEIGAYSAYVSGELYSQYRLDNTFVYVLCGPEDARFTPGRRYALAGMVRDLIVTPIKGFEIMPATGLSSGTYHYAFPSVVDITEYGDTQTFLDSAESHVIKEAGDTFRILNESVDVTATSHIHIVENFHNGRYMLLEGRFFESNDKNVCILPLRMAAQMKLTVGDTLRMSFHYPACDTARLFSYHPEIGFAAEDIAYTIVGIYQADALDLPVFIPYTGQDFLAHSANDPVLARVSVDKHRLEAYRDAVASIEGVHLTLNDQGYQAMDNTISAMRGTSMVVTFLCLFLCISSLWLFGLLFIGRNERSAKVLLMLGAGKKRVMRFFLSLGGMITAAAALTGTLVGYCISRLVFTLVYTMAMANSAYDSRFSATGFHAQNGLAVSVRSVSPQIYLLLAPAVTLVSLLFCTYFALAAIRKMNPRRRLAAQMKVKRKPVKSHKAIGAGLMLPTVALRYGVKSALRGGMRSLAVPAVFAVMVFFLCIFSSVNAGFQKEMDAAYASTPVTMQFSDINGRRIDDLFITSRQTDAVLETGFVEQMWASVNLRFMVLGVTEYAGGTYPAVPLESFVPPESLIGRIAFLDQWRSASEENVHLRIDGGPAVFANAPEFNFTAAQEITWAEGYDENRFFSNADSDEAFATIVVSETFLQKNNVSIGDTMAVLYLTSTDAFMNGNGYFETNVTIAGVYPGTAYHSNAYTYYSGGNWLDGYEWSGAAERTHVQYRYHSAGFLINDTKNLRTCKDMLGVFVDPLGRAGTNRVWIVIADEALHSAVDSLARYTGYMDMLYPVILALVAGIGFIVSHLLLKGRVGEIICLRSIGMTRRSVFFSFFHEQLLLSLIGISAGIAAICIWGGWGAMDVISILLLSICYYAGLMLAIVQIYRKAAMQAAAAAEE